MAQAALLYHDDIDFVNPVDFLRKQFDWKEVREPIKSTVPDPSLMFSEGGTRLREGPANGRGGAEAVTALIKGTVIFRVTDCLRQISRRRQKFHFCALLTFTKFIPVW